MLRLWLPFEWMMHFIFPLCSLKPCCMVRCDVDSGQNSESSIQGQHLLWEIRSCSYRGPTSFTAGSFWNVHFIYCIYTHTSYYSIVSVSVRASLMCNHDDQHVCLMKAQSRDMLISSDDISLSLAAWPQLFQQRRKMTPSMLLMQHIFLHSPCQQSQRFYMHLFSCKTERAIRVFAHVGMTAFFKYWMLPKSSGRGSFGTISDRVMLSDWCCVNSWCLLVALLVILQLFLQVLQQWCWIKKD